MNISFYTAAVGAQQQQRRLDIHGNNLANVNNYGFHARIPAFSQLMTGPVRGINEELPRGAGSRLDNAEMDTRSAGLSETGRALDYAIVGSGYFALQDPYTGEYSYSRDGSFIMSQFQQDETVVEIDPEQWYLTDGNGRFVMSRNGQPIPVTGQQSIESPGTPLNVGIFGFINYDGVNSLEDNRMIPVDKNGNVLLSNAELIQGYLERSNTDVATEFAKVIESQRSFSYMLKMVTASDEVENTVNGLR